jgi:hypothetical protein
MAFLSQPPRPTNNKKHFIANFYYAITQVQRAEVTLKIYGLIFFHIIITLGMTLELRANNVRICAAAAQVLYVVYLSQQSRPLAVQAAASSKI